jgi:hypothetical protein
MYIRHAVIVTSRRIPCMHVYTYVCVCMYITYIVNVTSRRIKCMHSCKYMCYVCPNAISTHAIQSRCQSCCYQLKLHVCIHTYLKYMCMCVLESVKKCRYICVQIPHKSTLQCFKAWMIVSMNYALFAYIHA